MGLAYAGSRLLWLFPASGQQLLCVGFIFTLFHHMAFSGRSGSLCRPVNHQVMASLCSAFQKLLQPLSAASGLAGW